MNAKKVLIIAEAGVNHNGDVGLAKRMIKSAKEAGADYIKFQTFIPEKLVSKNAQKAEYQKKTTNVDESQLQMLKKLALKQKEFIQLKEYCDTIGIGFISTPFELESVDFLETLNMDFWKIPSGEITNYPYLVKIAQTGGKVILSTGMSRLSEVEDAINVLKQYGSSEIVLLHCNTQYPTPFSAVNLNAMQTMKMVTGLQVGYSDHTLGIEVPIAAVAMGAVVIEKHFTLDKNMEGPDHRASLEPEELHRMISAVRNIEKALGDGEKAPSDSEKENIVIARKSIIAARTILKGELLTDDNLTTKRPGTGISSMKWPVLIGKRASRNYCEDELIDEEL